MAEPTIAHWRKYGKYETFKFWTHPPVKPQCTEEWTGRRKFKGLGMKQLTRKGKKRRQRIVMMMAWMF